MLVGRITLQSLAPAQIRNPTTTRVAIQGTAGEAVQADSEAVGDSVGAVQRTMVDTIATTRTGIWLRRIRAVEVLVTRDPVVRRIKA